MGGGRRGGGQQPWCAGADAAREASRSTSTRVGEAKGRERERRGRGIGGGLATVAGRIAGDNTWEKVGREARGKATWPTHAQENDGRGGGRGGAIEGAVELAAVVMCVCEASTDFHSCGGAV